MAKFERLRQTSPNLILRVFLEDSTSTTGAGKTGVVRTQSDLKINVMRELSSTCTNYVGGTSVEDITTLGTYAAPTSANVRFKEVDATNLPGIYEIHLEQSFGGTSDASKFVTGMIRATNVAPCPFEIELTATDKQDGVRAGMTALPNAAAAASGGLMILGSNNTAAITIGALTVGAISGTTLALTAISGTTLTLSGAVAFQSTFAVTGTTTLAALTTTGTVTCNALTITNAFTLSDGGASLWNTLLDLTAGIETGLTVRQFGRAVFSSTAAKVSGAGTGTITFLNKAGSVSRMIVTSDSSGNRSAITYDFS